MDASELPAVLVALGCPEEKSAAMAAQLDKRAKQLAGQKQRSYEEALAHLLGLMRQGWAAKDRGFDHEPGSNLQAPTSGPGAGGSSPSSHRLLRLAPLEFVGDGIPHMLKPWQKINSTPAGDYRIFRIRKDRAISPRTQQEHEFVVIETANWVNVIAVTPDQHLVLVEQFRHSSNTIELEIPGGVIDPRDASPVAAGVRELREETGYEGENARIIGEVFPNPAIMSNTCFTVLLENCRCVHPVEFDHGEDLVTRLVPVAEIPDLVARGKIRHCIVIAALYYFELWGLQAKGKTS